MVYSILRYKLIKRLIIRIKPAQMSMKSALLLILAIGSVAVTAILFLPDDELGLKFSERFEWDERVEAASGDAYMGPWRMNDSDFRLVDDPAVSLNDDGAAAVVWADQEKQNIFMQIYEPNGEKRFNEPVNVSNNPGIFSWLPRAIISSDNPEHVYVLWQEIVFSGGSHGGEIFFARSVDGGQTFNGPLNLSNSKAGAGKGRFTPQRWFNGNLDLAKSENGALYAAWTEYEGALWFSRSTDNGESFSEPKLAGGSDEIPARAPSIAAGRDGNVYLAWSAGEGHQADIRFAKSGDYGQNFDQPVDVLQSDGHSDAPRFVVDSNETIHLVYSESPNGLWNSYHIRYSKSNAGTGSFEESKRISGPETGQVQSSAYPVLRIDGGDNLYVLWELFPELGRRSRGLGITMSDNGGDAFYPPEAVDGSVEPGLGFNGSRQGMLMNKLDVNSRGDIAVVNSTFSWGNSSHIWLFRGKFSGGP